MTRAWLSALSLNFEDAFFYHPLFWLVPIIFGVVLLRHKLKICYALYNSKYFFVSCLILFIGVYIVRLFLLFPQTAPMDFNDQAILLQIVRKILHV